MTSSSSSSTSSAPMLYGLEHAATILNNSPLQRDVHVEMLAKIDEIMGATDAADADADAADEVEHDQVPIGEPVFARVQQYLENAQVLLQLARRDYEAEERRVRQEMLENSQGKGKGKGKGNGNSGLENRLKLMKQRVSKMNIYTGLFVTTVRNAETTWALVQRFRQVEQTATGPQKNVKREKTLIKERIFNKLATFLRMRFKIPKEIMPNACKGHGANLRHDRLHASAGNCLATMVPYSSDELVDLASTRRIRCRIAKENLMSGWLHEIVEHGAMVPNNQTILCGPSKSNKISQGTHLVLTIGCICFRNCGKEASGLTVRKCNHVFNAKDPYILGQVTQAEARRIEATCDFRSAILQQKASSSSTQQFAGKMIKCINTDCRLSREAITHTDVNGVVHTLDGIGFFCTPPSPDKHGRPHHHHGKVTCPECATQWCDTCKAFPYHETRACLGAPNEDLPEAGSKKCPGCNHATVKVPTECDKITCLCGVLWCYCCRKKLVNRVSPYRHKCPDNFDREWNQDLQRQRDHSCFHDDSDFEGPDPN